MKVIIAGSRTIRGFRGEQLLIEAIIASNFQITEVFCGCAKGVDELGRKWARINDIPVRWFPAAWLSIDGTTNYRAGFERNERMADAADALIAIWDGHSNGTRHMIKCMGRRGKPVYYIDLDPEL